MHIIKEFLKGSRFESYEITLASADASFRRYFRLEKEGETFIVMDSSKELDSLKPFVDITKRLRDAKVNAPRIYLQDLERGFLVLQDFGSADLLDVLDESNFEYYYKMAIDEICKMQEDDAKNLPLYDAKFLIYEMDLMQEWFLQKYLSITLDAKEEMMLKDTLSIICREVLKQPQGFFVHRDFHSRNIMFTKDDTLGIIDYQDAMRGAVTYDLVSLLRDLYISFEPSKIEALALYFRDKKEFDTKDAEFLKWFDFMGLQRHIKVLGIFARLYLRDAKDGYLKDLPLTLKYVLDISKKYDETKKLHDFLSKIILKENR